VESLCYGGQDLFTNPRASGEWGQPGVGSIPEGHEGEDVHHGYYPIARHLLTFAILILMGACSCAADMTKAPMLQRNLSTAKFILQNKCDIHHFYNIVTTCY
jgi:hypothetical protein